MIRSSKTKKPKHTRVTQHAFICKACKGRFMTAKNNQIYCSKRDCQVARKMVNISDYHENQKKKFRLEIMKQEGIGG